MSNNNTYERFGHFMVLLAWAVLIALLTLFFNKWLETKYHQIPSLKQVTLTDGNRYTILERNYANHYLAKGLINEQPAVFLLDTGATEVVIPADLAKKLNLKQGKKLSAQTAAGKISIYETNIEKLVLGHLVFENVKANINPKMKGKEILLGMNVLKTINFQQQNGYLYLSEQFSP